jgi:hypothetical protein
MHTSNSEEHDFWLLYQVSTMQLLSPEVRAETKKLCTPWQQDIQSFIFLV